MQESEGKKLARAKARDACSATSPLDKPRSSRSFFLLLPPPLLSFFFFSKAAAAAAAAANVRCY